jgi:glucose/mannose-6-phosphate isomerase
MHPLDESGLLTRLDPHGMMALTLDFPAQCERAMQLASDAPAPTLPRPPRQVVVCGMGGSAIGGDYLRALFEEYGDLPVQVIRDYHLPHSVDAHTLVFAVSYSGNTEETLACYGQARAREAMIIAISSGGELQQRAYADGVYHLQVPGGQPPRTALGYLFIPLMRLAERLGLLPDLSQPYSQMLQRLVQTRDALQMSVPYEQNPAKQLAQALHRRIPLIYGSGGARATVAMRWKGQINENAKQHAFAYTFPELNHNEILGWVKASEQARQLERGRAARPRRERENPHAHRSHAPTGGRPCRVARTHCRRRVATGATDAPDLLRRLREPVSRAAERRRSREY